MPMTTTDMHTNIHARDIHNQPFIAAHTHLYTQCQAILGHSSCQIKCTYHGNANERQARELHLVTKEGIEKLQLNEPEPVTSRSIFI